MSHFGDIRSAIHNDDMSRVKKLIREYEGDNFSEAEAIARYFIDMYDEFPTGFSGFIWNAGSLEMRVGIHQVPLMKISNHAAQSVMLPLRRQVLNKSIKCGYTPSQKALREIDAWVFGNIEDWLMDYDETRWPYISRTLLWCQRNKTISIHRPESGAFLYAGNNLDLFLKRYYNCTYCKPAERKALRLDINRYLLKEYKCP